MSRKTNRAIRTLAAVLMAAALAPSASLAYRDSRSQDALDAARSLPPDQLIAVSERLHSPSQDLRSQDARDAARSLPPDQLIAVSERLHSPSQDLRSQDARDAARSLPPDQLVAVSERLRSPSHDLRSPDALDAARSLPSDQLVAVSERLRSTASKPAIVRVGQSDEFNWSSAVMGAAGLLGLIGVSLAVLLGVRQNRRRPAQA